MIVKDDQFPSFGEGGKKKKIEDFGEQMKGSQLFQPYRALGFVTDENKFHLHHNKWDSFITTEDEITAFIRDEDCVFIATGRSLEEGKEGVRSGQQSTPPEAHFVPDLLPLSHSVDLHSFQQSLGLLFVPKVLSTL